jgi:hypothetical protein
MLNRSLLSIRCQALEATRLAALAASLPDGRPAVALQDGTMMWAPWRAKAWSAGCHTTLLPELLGQYDRLQERRLPFAAYMSRPRHPDVVNTLRLLSEPKPLGVTPPHPRRLPT